MIATDADLAAYRSPLLTSCPCGRHASSEEHIRAVRVPRRARAEPVAPKAGRSGLLKFARDLLPRFGWGG